MNSCCFPPRSFYDVHKYFHYLLASKLARQIQGGITAYIPEFQVRASRNERTRRRKIVADDGLHQRCHTEAVLRIHVGTTPDQGLHARGRGSRRLSSSCLSNDARWVWANCPACTPLTTTMFASRNTPTPRP